MEQLDKEVIDKLSEPAKLSFSFFGLSFPTPDVKEGKRGWENKKEKKHSKRTGKKKSITKRQKRKRQAKERQFY